MTFPLTSARSLSALALGLLLQACAQNPVSDVQPTSLATQAVAVPAKGAGLVLGAPAASGPATAALPPAADFGSRRFEQAWDVVELMGQPMPASDQRPPRVVLRPQGGLIVDGGCNYFSGRTARDAQGLFRVSKYGGTHGQCEQPARSEVLLNSALVLVDSYRWDRGLVLRSGDRDLIRLVPSANQDSQDIERGLAGLTTAAAAQSAAAPAAQASQGNCRQVKTKVRKAGKLTTVSRLVCQPAQPASAKSRKGKAAAKAKASRSTSRSKPAASKPR